MKATILHQINLKAPLRLQLTFFFAGQILAGGGLPYKNNEGAFVPFRG